MPARIITVRQTPPLSRTLAIAVLVIASSAVVAWTSRDGPEARPHAGVRLAARAASPAAHPTAVDAHPEWVLPYAASLGDFPADAPAAATRAGATPRADAPPAAPTWLLGQSDLSPAAVMQTWRAYARTQGPSPDAMQELLAYARLHPARIADARGQSVDAWLQAAAADPLLLQQLVGSGYLDGHLSALFEASDARTTAAVVRDLDAASGCSGQPCGAWRARFAEAFMQEQAAAADPVQRCGMASAVEPPVAAVPDADDLAARGVARAMDTYLARQRSTLCGAAG